MTSPNGGDGREPRMSYVSAASKSVAIPIAGSKVRGRRRERDRKGGRRKRRENRKREKERERELYIYIFNWNMNAPVLFVLYVRASGFYSVRALYLLFFYTCLPVH